MYVMPLLYFKTPILTFFVLFKKLPFTFEKFHISNVLTASLAREMRENIFHTFTVDKLSGVQTRVQLCFVSCICTGYAMYVICMYGWLLKPWPVFGF